MKLLVINNLASGPGDGGIYDFARAFLEDGDEMVVRATDGATPIANLLSNASDFDAVVASGGDGTVTAVSFALANTGIPILPFPAGTANLLAMNLAQPDEARVLAKITRQRTCLEFDLGELEFDGHTVGFGMIAGAGYDAKIMQDAQPNKKALGAIAYAGAALANPLPQVSHFTLTLDGRTVESDGIGVLIVNFSRIQFDIPLTHGNNPRDGKFEVAILKAQNAFELIPALLAGILDREGDFPGRSDSVEVHKARVVRVEADPPMNIQFDGEVIDATTPFTARVLEEAATFIMSEEGYRTFKRTEDEEGDEDEQVSNTESEYTKGTDADKTQQTSNDTLNIDASAPGNNASAPHANFA
ncbi:diacylglycerol kinase family protein [Adlercreutzia sp. ZJ138]|uniref:diacylglycerol/lipid kinase family protein n=1 Tax=Adlercreutzia sp. ZJ138 TaxID=2709405 RepID=UPI0013EA823A|nr:diacylglycerol kinase family protein [Adlercreutzia sp. ZJ138]